MEQINDILAKHFSDTELSVDEQSILTVWVEKNENEYHDLKKTWSAVPDFKYHSFDKKLAWDTMDSKIETEDNINSQKKPKIFSLKPILKYAVAASIAVLLSIGGFKYFNQKTLNYISFENTSDQSKSIVLEDGSTIYLAKNSVIEYQENFADNRSIKLNGEAFFDVNRDESHPFIINTDYGDVKVLGTSFNINTKNNQTKVSVKSGLVELSNKATLIQLKKNESAISNGKSISERKENEINYLSWKTGGFVFDNTPINKAVDLLNTYYKTSVIIDSNVSEKCKITGVFKQEKIEHIVEAITLSCNLVFNKKDNQIIIK